MGKKTKLSAINSNEVEPRLLNSKSISGIKTIIKPSLHSVQGSVCKMRLCSCWPRAESDWNGNEGFQ
jgi:hypothetical protein